MIDIHSHILPGVDDGAQSIEDSIEMAKQAVNEGITKIIATPHHQNGKYVNKKQDIIDRVLELNSLFSNKKIPLEVLPGQETRIFGELLENLEKGEILTLNNLNYIFVELPSGHVPRYTEKLLFDVQLQGLTPVIVHPERNAEIMENPNKLLNLVKKGALTQVTAGSITGHFGKKIKKFSLDLIDANLTHFLASDAHNVSNRSFKIRESISEIEKEFGSQAVYYFQENAELLIKGQAVYNQEPSQIKRRKFLGFF
ncbi:tyrosine-protein phosphatase [Metabacillus sediminilitoris]|uniref:Tyrosine-protein phosphatase n=1 Tax=Metabacillus sediminilitoris TaxID=2567941 RepID=A0A4S4C146_9BACI|nr:CpsB/CapC family capsule biosynthesis tyrosine phosphatase [Metabacillus sediminilitoris]QGQ48279.1 tyrosine protein phosphatase [Metabacillus sediminilitoris]THF81363.1 tyrosine protein phosphatase [Metabacillus sediminilitoris]